MNLQDLANAAAELLTQHDAATPVASSVDFLSTVDLIVVSSGGVKKIVVIEKAN
jgi:hypothetical protein